MERIANPVTGRTDDGSMLRVPPTRLMVACRYALALLTPIYVAVAVLGAEQLSWWVTLGLYMLVLLPLSAGANGSWWRTAPWDVWPASGLAAAGVLLVGLLVTVVTGERLVMVLASTLIVGAVLGVGAAHAWRHRHGAAP
jgi:hypothetical protein